MRYLKVLGGANLLIASGFFIFFIVSFLLSQKIETSLQGILIALILRSRRGNGIRQINLIRLETSGESDLHQPPRLHSVLYNPCCNALAMEFAVRLPDATGGCGGRRFCRARQLKP